MPTTETGAVKALKRTIKNQKEAIVVLKERIGLLADDIVILQNDLKGFKTNVAADINELFDRFDNK